MEPLFNRRDIGYTVISRFEEAFRGFVSKNISSLYSDFKDGIPSGIIEKAKNRTSKIEWDDPDDFLEDIEFPDLKEIVCFKNQYPVYFSISALSQDDFRTIMDELYILRCKIAHIREYFSILDLSNLFENTNKIAFFLEEWGKDFLNIISSLNENPRDVVIPLPIEFISDEIDNLNVPNNMPTPDYEYEGGFVGRDDDIKRLTSLLEGDLHRVVTISGAGGVGKTALALQVIRELVKKSKSIFDGIVWLSAKETKLSCVGIEIVEPTVKSYEQLLAVCRI